MVKYPNMEFIVKEDGLHSPVLAQSEMGSKWSCRPDHAKLSGRLAYLFKMGIFNAEGIKSTYTHIDTRNTPPKKPNFK